MSQQLPTYDSREEWANALTHGLGLVLAIIAFIWLLLVSSSADSSKVLVSSIIYGTTLIFMFLASTLYHAIQQRSARLMLRQVDHLAILYLIAGSYTPFTLVTLSGAWGWSIFGVVWGLTALGTALQFSPARHLKGLMVSLYLLMGWTVLVALKPLVENLASGGVSLLVIGGLFYSSGVIFYVNKRIPYNHAIWHLFVLAGAACHCLAIGFYVL